MVRTDAGLPTFERGSLVPLATYAVVLCVLSVLVSVSQAGAPPPLLGMAWGLFLVALVVGVYRFEGASPRSLVPSGRAVGSAFGIVVVFWVSYNLVAVGLAAGGVGGFAATPSRVLSHPTLYLLAFLSSLLFTALPEELVFRAYLQQKVTVLVGATHRRAVVTGVVSSAVLFALFHLPRWVLASGHGVTDALAGRLLGLTIAGLAFGVVYAQTRNVWLVALFHATMNQPPFLSSVNIPSDLHLVAAVLEYGSFVCLVSLAVWVGDSDGTVLPEPGRERNSSTGD
jgi:membrane protease YdiL (CAAX protease family)